MHHIVELVAAQLFLQPLLRREVQLDEVDALVLQELPRAAATHSSPRLEPPAEGFFNDETSR